MADNVYNLKFTLSNGDVIDAGQITAPQGPKGDKGDSATIDANTLLALLLGSNGIAIAKNAAGDKVEVKLAIPETGPITLTNNNVPRPAISIEVADGGPPAFGGITISNATDSDKVVRLGPRQVLAKSGVSELTFDANGITSRDNGNEVGHGLISGGPKGNVKTLFGNQQSIYGSGNIDLYKHNLIISQGSTESDRMCVYCQIISSNNLNISSLADFETVVKENEFIPATGKLKLYKGDTGSVIGGVCINGAIEYNIQGKYTNTIDFSSGWITIRGAVSGGLTFYDNVTTV